MICWKDKNYWALILGGSSGFGLATAKKLARSGMNVCVVHRDRRGSMERIEREFEEIRSSKIAFKAFNLDALKPEGRASVLDELSTTLNGGKVRVLLHSIAFGSLRLVAPLKDATTDSPHDSSLLLQDEELAETIFSMGTSLLSWTRDLFARKMFATDARVLGLTSEGNEIAWRGYAAVSAAKVALESVSRSIAKEFAPFGVRSNIVQPGVTDTPALRLIPGNEAMRAAAQIRNPFGRLTTPEDVANVIALLCTDEAAWVNGDIIRVDGGEKISG